MKSRSTIPSKPPIRSTNPNDHGGAEWLAAPISDKEQQAALPDDVVALFPNLKRDLDRGLAIDLAYEEYKQLYERGDCPDPEQFCERYPQFKTSLLKVMEVHHFFQLKSKLLKDFDNVPWPEVGQTFCGFLLHRELGRGGFSRVYLATELDLGDRPVAVKITLHGDGEAATLGRLNHPNIVPIYSMRPDWTTGLTALCMPYLGATTLHHVLKLAFSHPGQLPERAQVILQAAQPQVALSSLETPAAPQVMRQGTYVEGIRHLVAQLADALVFIHGKDFFHRDLKPSNILVGPDGTPMLLDFNLAHGPGAEERLGGTLPYMAPEQLRATDPEGGPDPELLDDRSDLYSLGVILYELLAGAHPFAPIPLQPDEPFRKILLERQVHGPNQPLYALNPAVDRPLSQLVERCLAFRREDRPRCLELAAGLREGLAPSRPIRRWVARPTLAALGILLLALTLVGTTAGTGFWHASIGNEDTLAPKVQRSANQPPEVKQDADTVNENPLARGKDSYRKGNFQEAVGFFDQVLQSDPTNAQARFDRGRAYQRLGEQQGLSFFNNALEDFLEAERLAPTNITKACVGYCLNRLGNHKQAVFFYQRAVHDKNFERAEVYNNLGFSYLAGKKLSEALKHLDHAIQLNPDLQTAYLNRAWVFYKKALGVLLLPEQARQGLPPIVVQEARAAAASGVADLEIAMTKGAASAELYLDAARLCALLAPLDENRLHSGLVYLSKAVGHGLDPKVLKDELENKNGNLGAYLNSERFKALAASPSPRQPPPPLRRILDAVRDDPR